MNFKVFLKTNNFLFEGSETESNSNPEQAKDAFIKSAYRRVFPNGKETDTDQMWNAVRSKAYYKLTKNSKTDTKKSVQIAKGAINQAKAKKEFNLETGKDTEDKDSATSSASTSTQDKILKHLEDWDDKDVQDLIKDSDLLKEKDIKTVDDLRSAISELDDDKQKEVFEKIKGLESDVDEISWKDKTFSDLESISDEDFNAIKDKLKDIPGSLGWIKFESKEELKDYLKNNADPETLKSLDSLLSKQDAQDSPNSQGASNQEILDSIQEKQKKAELSDHLSKIGLDLDTLDTSIPEVAQKVLDSGDPVLYDQYITQNLSEKSPLVQKIKQEEEQRMRTQREALERRTERFESLRKTGEVLSNVALVFDVLKGALTGSGDTFFQTMTDKRMMAKGITEGLSEGLDERTKKQIEEEDSQHELELKALESDYNNRLEKLEQQRTDPVNTVAYKKLASLATQKFAESKKALSDESKIASQKVADVSSLNVFLATDNVNDLSSLSDTQVETMANVLKEKFPAKEDEDTSEYLSRVKDEANQEDIQKIIDDANYDLEQCKEKEKELSTQLEKAFETLKDHPEVKDEMKLSEENIKNQRENIESEFKQAQAIENERHLKFSHCVKKIAEENKRFYKNLGVLMAYSGNPEQTLAQEMANHNKRMRDRSKLETGVDMFTDEDCPTNPDAVLELFRNSDGSGFRRVEKAEKAERTEKEEREEPESPESPEEQEDSGGPEEPETTQDAKEDSEQDGESPETDKEPESPETTQDTGSKPLKIDSDLDSVKKYLGNIRVGDEDFDLGKIDQDSWKEKTKSPEFRDALEKALQSPSVLTKLSGDTDMDSEKKEVDSLKDEESTGSDESTETGKNPSLKQLGLKSLWKLLNQAGISIRALPGYSPEWSDEEKKKTIEKYIKDHKTEVSDWENLNESLAFSRLNSLREANDKKIQKKSLRKFAELLVNDVRTFG